jgi:hypothetical protein
MIQTFSTKIKFIGMLMLLASIFQPSFSQALQSNKYNSIGFTTIRKTDNNGNHLLISIWYPAVDAGSRMSLRDYLLAGKITSDIKDETVLDGFRNVLERLFPGPLGPLPDSSFKRLLSTTYKSAWNASQAKGKFPLLLAVAKPDSYIETFESLSAHGFVVAAITTIWKDEPNDTLLYMNATHVLEDLLHFMKQQSYIDTGHIAAFGHGGGIQPAFYLAMRDPAIKLLINLDGGVFGPRSKTILSPDYKPWALKIPFLHIITQSEKKEDDPAQFNALSNLRYRLIIKSESVVHHDFTTWGRVAVNQLGRRDSSAALVNNIFLNINNYIIAFLKDGQIKKSLIPQKYFQYDVF